MKRDFKSLDILLILLVLGISIFGIVIIGSATGINMHGSSQEFEKQRLWLISGLVLLCLALFLDYHIICRFYIFIYIFGFLMLLILLIIGLKDDDSVTRWLEIGSFVIQPSEFFKIFIIIFLSELLSKENIKINNVFTLLAVLAMIALPVIMIMIQPSLSASMVSLVIGIVIVFVSGLSFVYILGAVALLVPTGLFAYFDILREEPIFINKILGVYQIQRITTFLNPDPGSDLYYQTNQGIRALGSGQLYGKGLYQGVINQSNHLPAAYNDFIFSVIGEEFGFIGCSIVLIILLLIIAKCIYIAAKAYDFKGKLIAAGVAGMLAFQTFVNVGVATGMLPNTGMPLPFISYGGSSMWVNMIAIGLVLNVGLFKSKSLFESRK